jgi:hypothetical protein
MIRTSDIVNSHWPLICSLFSYAAEVRKEGESGSYFDPLAIWIFKDNGDDLINIVLNCK